MHKWEVNIKTNLKEIICEVMGLDRSLGNTVMNLRVSQMVRNFLTAWQTI